MKSAVPRNHRADIDGLRAIAVLSVILYHAFPNVIHGGYVGVDIFFVISGFLISSIIFAEIREGHFSIATFFQRRIARIFPALAICLAAVLIYGFVILTPPELAQLGKHVFLGASFLSNIALWNESGYFDGAAVAKPLLHLWSLGIEEQFYIVWPALLWLASRIEIRIFWLLAALILASFTANIVFSVTDISADFYLPVARFWELLAGASLARRGHFAMAPLLRSWISIAGLAAILASATLFTPELRFPGWFALAPVLGTVAIIFAGPQAWTNRVVLSNRAAIFVGLISYPLYLWHWPLISFAYVIRMGKQPTPLMAVILIAASILLAWATNRFVENPVRFGERRLRKVWAAAICMLAVGSCGLIVWISGGFPQRYSSLPGIDVRKIGDARLDSSFKATDGMEMISSDWTIIAGLGSGTRKIGLSGDSLLFQYGPRVQKLSDEGDLAVRAYFVAGPNCAPVPGLLQRDKFAACAKLPGILLDLVQRERLESVVLGASWSGYVDEHMLLERDGRRFPLNTSEGVDAFYANLRDFVQLLQFHGAKVYLVLGPPHHIRFNPAEMVSRSWTGFRIANDVESAVPVGLLLADMASVNAKLRQVAERTGATIVDPLPDICGSGGDCSPFFGAGEPKFSDGTHLRPVFVRDHIHFLDSLLERK
jgi:peptidoglycan/LPS O-acetylase OafA/YrhL